MKEIRKKAEEFLKKLTKVKPLQATVVGLHGDLGSGKTTFTKIVGELLGIKETIQSPTFVIQKIYKTKHPIFKNFYHLDLYRIEDPKELKIFHFDEIFDDPKNLIFIEWPEKGGGFLPGDMIMVNFKFINENTREISYLT